MRANTPVPPNPSIVEHIEGIEDPNAASWGDYPIDDLLIRNETRTIHDVIRRINNHRYIMDPDFQRDFIWTKDKQSKLIESVIMRIPLPVFYMAEDAQGRLVVVDGLQRLSTFHSFIGGGLKLHLPDRPALNGKKFVDLDSKLQNRVEDCNLIFYIIDSRVPERARLDIFERVNGGVVLTRQQMRNCLYMGQATRFLKAESRTEIFRRATGGSLRTEMMRDREFVNRFCAFQLLDPLTSDEYRGDMDDFLALSLRKMNQMDHDQLLNLATQFHHGLENNFILHDHHAFRKHAQGQKRRSVLNASLWDVMSTGLSYYSQEIIEASAEPLRQKLWHLLDNSAFDAAITIGTNHVRNVKTRFTMAHAAIREVLGAHAT